MSGAVTVNKLKWLDPESKKKQAVRLIIKGDGVVLEEDKKKGAAQLHEWAIEQIESCSPGAKKNTVQLVVDGVGHHFEGKTVTNIEKELGPRLERAPPPVSDESGLGPPPSDGLGPPPADGMGPPPDADFGLGPPPADGMGPPPDADFGLGPPPADGMGPPPDADFGLGPPPDGTGPPPSGFGLGPPPADGMEPPPGGNPVAAPPDTSPLDISGPPTREVFARFDQNRSGGLTQAQVVALVGAMGCSTGDAAYLQDTMQQFGSPALGGRTEVSFGATPNHGWIPAARVWWGDG
jgi:hypothetical protein